MERDSIIEEDPIIHALSQHGEDRMAPFLEFHKENVSNRNSGKSFSSGIGTLDDLLHGFSSGEVNVITGPTGNGKTLFADTLGQGFMRLSGIPIAWFSFEVPTEQMIEKYVQASDRDKLGLFVPMEMKAGNFEWLKLKCLEAKMKYNCQVIFIDHLHFLVDMETKLNMSLNIGAVMRQIKHDIAKEMGLMVFLIAHQGQPGSDAEPSLGNIRDSSFIGQESDNVFVVYRCPDPLPEELRKNENVKGYPRTYEEGYATVKIEKARRSGVYRKKLLFQKVGQWLQEA